jgi:formylglycine-generating enzyme required for sulfatase activity
MEMRLKVAVVATALAMTATTAAAAGFPKVPVRSCAPDAVVAGTICLDRYEASVWRVPNPTTMNASLVRRIQLGRATRADLMAGGATQLGTAGDDYAPCSHDGQSCADDVYAVSLPAVLPSAFVTWFQAQAACANAGKRLPTNAEWQVGANGTPDPGPDDHATTCNSANNGTTTLTGARSNCVSSRGAFDMVGNVAEWVADWEPLSTGCLDWASFSEDLMCLSGASETGPGPGALLRGGFFFGGAVNGPLSVIGTVAPTRSQDIFGFRCAR